LKDTARIAQDAISRGVGLRSKAGDEDEGEQIGESAGGCGCHKASSSCAEMRARTTNKKPAERVPPLSRFRDWLPPRHGRARDSAPRGSWHLSVTQSAPARTRVNRPLPLHFSHHSQLVASVPAICARANGRNAGVAAPASTTTAS